ncbi:ribosome hibernation promoting factor [Moellerella wisconsensis]|uniref:Ribosome hibernation promoting factor n=1 Tax=Moellerella wisconsensis ATCC 35017 TaxID=1354267 RepID=A0A0N0IC59_9GAMM|nr:ribosome hibernation promoting factor [Moellerella wisconsensis]KPD04483.1 ribosome hibernation protein [Moellerella wisconsensis ATCC 35017]UNH24581.1 ribosome hibernation promoting factor [Moellerella wisconsensis]VFS52514.1 ribosome hibernation promoting factor HPF [Moellerella wisconsensis]
MEFQITGQNIEITSALRETVEKKCKKLEQLFDRINGIQVILKVEKLNQIAEATVQVNAADLHASAESSDMYAAIDMLVDKLSRQITKHKEKLRQH